MWLQPPKCSEPLQLNVLVMYSCQHLCTWEEFIIKGILPVGVIQRKGCSSSSFQILWWKNFKWWMLSKYMVHSIHFWMTWKKKKKDILGKQWDLLQLHFNLEFSAIYIPLGNQRLGWFWNVYLCVYSDSWETDLLKIKTSYSIFPSLLCFYFMVLLTAVTQQVNSGDSELLFMVKKPV